MKKILFTITAFITSCMMAYSQVPVTSGLIQHLDAAIGFIPGNPPNTYPFLPACGGASAIPPAAYARWTDQSPYANHVKTPPLQTWCDCGGTCTGLVGILTNANPTYIPNAWSTTWATYPAIRFDGNDLMETIPGSANPIAGGTNPIDGSSGLSPASGLKGSDNVREVTLFVVRTQANPAMQSIAGNDDTYGMVSLSNSDNSGFPGMFIPFPPGTYFQVRDGFDLMRDWAAHTTFPGHGPIASSSSSITFKTHQCFSATPGNRPVVLSASFGSNYGDVNYYVNGILSTNPLQEYPPGHAATNHNAINRLITIGATRTTITWGVNWSTLTRADIFEVLVYNRKLTPTEITQVNNYLKCKYDMQYTACNAYPSDCPRNCWSSPQLNITYLSKDPLTGLCSYSATATATPRTGASNYGYEWTFPGGSPFVVVSALFSNTQTFTMAPFDGTVKVRLLGNNTTASGLGCCDFTMSGRVYCGDVGGGVYSRQSFSAPEEEETKKIDFYPNPTSRDMFVKIPYEGMHTIAVFDFSGREIKHISNNDQLNTISFEGHANGVYMIMVKDANGKILENKKVIFQP